MMQNIVEIGLRISRGTYSSVILQKEIQFLTNFLVVELLWLKQNYCVATLLESI